MFLKSDRYRIQPSGFNLQMAFMSVTLNVFSAGMKLMQFVSTLCFFVFVGTRR